MSESGHLYIIAAPSGTGKTSLVKELIESLSRITVSISHTTRPKRPGEEHGRHYYFVDHLAFKQMIDQDGFLEYAAIYDHYYGTSKAWVEKTLAKGTDVILEIDWQGHLQIKKLFPFASSIFILPPSIDHLRERLIKRNQDSKEVITHRLADAKNTLSHLHEFDYLIINDNFDRALHDLSVIIEAGRLTQKRQINKFKCFIDD